MKTNPYVRTASVGILTFALFLGLAWAKEGKKASAKKKDASVTSLFDFETDLDGWRIPEWAFAKKDNAVLEVGMTDEVASSGKKSLKMNCVFPPKMWSGAYVEIERESGDFMDFSAADSLMVDVFVPADAPKKLKGEIILTVGENWSWTEMRQAVELIPGQWTTLKADVTPLGTDWKVRLTDELRSDVRKLGVRVQSNYIQYAGTAYVDNVRLGSAKKKKM